MGDLVLVEDECLQSSALVDGWVDGEQLIDWQIEDLQIDKFANLAGDLQKTIAFHVQLSEVQASS